MDHFNCKGCSEHKEMRKVKNETRILQNSHQIFVTVLSCPSGYKKSQLQCASKIHTNISSNIWESLLSLLLRYGFISLPKKRKSSIHLVSIVTRGMFRSLTSLKINIQRSLAQDGECGLTSSSRLPSLSTQEIMLARRGVTAPWTRFQRVCLCVGETEAGPLRLEGPQTTLGCPHPFHILCLHGSNKISALLFPHYSCVFHVFYIIFKY